MLDAPLLLFMCARYDSRKPLVRYSKQCQAVTASGFDRIRAESSTLNELRSRICGLQTAIGLVRTSALLFSCTGRSGHRRDPPRLSIKTIYCFLLCMAQKSGMFRVLPTVTLRLLEMLMVKSFQGVLIGYSLPRGTEPAGPRGWALMPFDNAKKQSARKALGQTKQPSNFGSTISDQLRFVRQEVHHDLGLALQRCLIVAKRDRELFRTRVLYFDSEATHKQRFTPPPKAKVGKQKNPAGQPRTHPSIMRGMPDYDSESSDSEGNVDTEHRSSSDSQDESSDSDLGETADLPDATSTDHRFFETGAGSTQCCVAK